jgi:hypothetical protein
VPRTVVEAYEYEQASVGHTTNVLRLT